MGRVAGFRFISATVPDLDAALRFWCRGLGLRLDERGTDKTAGGARFEWARVQLPRGCTIVLRTPPVADADTSGGAVERPPAPHVGLEVVGLADVLAQLQMLGYDPVPGDDPGGPAVDAEHTRSTLVSSPDGLLIELAEVHH
jgi:catechol 2,3-dioxygenase-like lactoylglutathione lyase family enzyme